jgi:hypothetical protein
MREGAAMKTQLIVACLAAAFAFSSETSAQMTRTIEAEPMEGIVTVTAIDQAARMVTFKGPNGDERTVAVPAEAQNLDQVKPGSRFKVRFFEEVAVSVDKEGVASSGAGSAMQLAPKGGNPGGTKAQTVQVSGVVEKVDPAKHQLTVRGPQGNSRTLAVAKDVQLEAVKPGDTITVAYTQALAMEMIPTEEAMREPVWMR